MMSIFTSMLRSFLLLFVLCTSLFAHGQADQYKRLHVVKTYFYIENSQGRTISKESKDVSDWDKYVYIYKKMVQIDDKGRSVYYFTSGAAKEENDEWEMVIHDARDNNGKACEVGLLYLKESGVLVFFAAYKAGSVKRI